MLNEFDVLRDVSRRLTHAGIPYMLTGSLAMNYYSQPRMTRDIDLVVEAKEKDIDTLLSIFAPDYYIDRNSVSRAIARERAFNIIDIKAFIKVDFIIRKSSEYRLVEFERRREVTIQGVKV